MDEVSGRVFIKCRPKSRKKGKRRQLQHIYLLRVFGEHLAMGATSSLQLLLVLAAVEFVHAAISISLV